MGGTGLQGWAGLRPGGASLRGGVPKLPDPSGEAPRGLQGRGRSEEPAGAEAIREGESLFKFQFLHWAFHKLPWRRRFADLYFGQL